MTHSSDHNESAPIPDGITPAFIDWVIEALSHLYDLPFLRRQSVSPPLAGRFANSRALQDALLITIQQLRPPNDVPLSSPAWRTYNLLHLRYEQGLTQTEVAAKLGIGVRHLQREQQRAVEALATVLQEWLAAQPGNIAGAPQAEASDEDLSICRVEEVVRSGMSLLEPLMQEHNLRADVRMPKRLPSVRCSTMILRQFVISALNWLMTGVTNETLVIIIDIEGIETQPAEVVIRLRKPQGSYPGDALLGEQAETMQQLATATHAHLQLDGVAEGFTQLSIRLPTISVRCVLVVDDNLDEVELIRHYLAGTHEYDVLTATRSEDAIRQAVEQRPDCILLDVMMPGRDGWELLTRLKAYPETAGIPVVISSILREHDLARVLGASSELVKPFNAAQLVAALRSAISPPAHPAA